MKDWRLSIVAITLVAMIPLIVLAQSEPIYRYHNDFEQGAGGEWSSRNRDKTPRDERQFLGRFLNDRVQLSLAGLPPHKELTLSFDLLIIGTWDGNNTEWGPDQWRLRIIDGPVLLKTTFSNTRNPQAFPDPYPGGENTSYSGASEHNTLGYVMMDWSWDAVYRLSYTVAHEANSVIFEFAAAGLQFLDDESWGLDNVLVTLR